MAAEKKPSESPALSLLIADPDITRFLRNSEQNLFKHREGLKTISTPSLDQDGITALRATARFDISRAGCCRAISPG
ncbi:MAG TPA: hypothetical protein VK638_35700 [Edaphobacter sp.]|nr:hypothetical protein [Edaphobacter sp.]